MVKMSQQDYKRLVGKNVNQRGGGLTKVNPKKKIKKRAVSDNLVKRVGILETRIDYLMAQLVKVGFRLPDRKEKNG